MSFTITHPANGTEYRIFVSAPDPAREPGPWPAVLFMDGDDQFPMALKAYRSAREFGEAPPLLLVGVGYGASYLKPANKRVRDYTPTVSSDEPTSGGADAFLEFLTRILWPELRRRFPVREEERGIAGHSLGSLFALYALFQTVHESADRERGGHGSAPSAAAPLAGEMPQDAAPSPPLSPADDPVILPTGFPRRPFFDRVLASSPSLWWDNRALLCQAQRLREQQETLRAHLFLGVGEDDTPSMTGDMELFEDQLAARPFDQLEVVSQRFPERDHYNVLADSFRAGLIALYGARDA